MATPRDLDPKFKDENGTTPRELEEKNGTTELTDTEKVGRELATKEEVPMIVHRQHFIGPDGVAAEKVHGPMPVSDWPEYEKEHKL